MRRLRSLKKIGSGRQQQNLHLYIMTTELNTFSFVRNTGTRYLPRPRYSHHHTAGVYHSNNRINFNRKPDWDFEWQGAYHFNEMIKINPGTTVNASAFYDNTSSNFHNPNTPPQDICAGFNTTDEMFVIYYLYTPYIVGDEHLNLDSLTQSGITNIIKDHIKPNDFIKIQPNPVEDQFVVSSNWSSKSVIKIGIYDINGRLVYEENCSSDKNISFEKVFDLSKISPIQKTNVYLLRIYNNNGEVQYGKIISN
jgi:hypothetical protein